MDEHEDSLAELSMEACLQMVYKHDGPLFRQCCSMPPASARWLADPTGLASHALHPRRPHVNAQLAHIAARQRAL